ncbi:MAG: radical SAM protein, partial [Acidobacteriota bacterium]
MSFRRGLKLAGFARRHLGRMARGRREVMEHLSAPGTANLPMPTFVQLRITNLCNLRCKMCGQWGDTGIYRTGAEAAASDGERERNRIRELIGLNRQMALSDYVRLLDELAPSRPIISLFGGEPLLYPDVLPLIREIKKRDLTCSIITNGWRLEEMAEELVEAGVDSIMVSIDGTPEVHDRIRGQAGSFARAAAGVRAVARVRGAQESAVPMLLAILPVTELNLEGVAPALEELRKLPLDTVN